MLFELGDQIIIPSSTLQIEVNVQDNLSGCSDTKFIDVNFLKRMQRLILQVPQTS